MALSMIDQFLFTMIQLRSIPNNDVVSALFHIDHGTGTRYFTTWVLLMRSLLEAVCPVNDAVVQRLQDNMPAVFRSTFKGRPVVLTLDCLHWELESPSDSQAAKVTFSQYWNSSCGKVLIPLANLGGPLPPSAVHGGSITDPEITDAWKHLKDLPAGVYILADKGWVDYTTATSKHGIGIITPDKKRQGSDQFTADDSMWNQDVAHLRIHVERAIRRIREFRILNVRCPILRADLMSDIMTVCTLLTNFKAPTGGRDMDLTSRSPTGEVIKVSAYTLIWAPSVLGWSVPTAVDF